MSDRLQKRPATFALPTLLLLLLAFSVPGMLSASEQASVLILGSDCSGGACVVNSYGSGFIVKIDDAQNAAYVVTARHVVRGADRIYVLYDPISFPRDYVVDLKAGTIPAVLSTALVDKGHPAPTQIRSGLSSRAGGSSPGDAVFFRVESWVLGGGGHEYLALPQADHLDLFHILPASLERESDAALDVALLVVDDFPHYASVPVLYMVTPDSISTGTRIMTSGCDYGLSEGISQAEVQGTAVSGDPGYLTYESALVYPGFSGGPILIDGYVVAMNLTQNLTAESRIQARLASAFKDLVDGWIGLPRMQIDLAIESPEGARDGVVSTGQDFKINASARLDPNGQVLAPVAAVVLDLPDQYEPQGEVSGTLAIGGEKIWTMTSPSQIAGPHPIALLDASATPGADLPALAEITISTEEGAYLKGVLVEGPSDGGGLFLKDEFIVAIEFELCGQPLTGLAGEISIERARYQFEIIEGVQTQPIVIGRPAQWRLVAMDISAGAPISFNTDLQSLDRNGKPVSVELPPPMSVSIEKASTFRFYGGFGRLEFQNPSVEFKGELELGTKFRIANVSGRGIPLRFVLAAGFGIDDAWNKETMADDGSTPESMIADLRYWGGAGVSAGFGPAEICLDLGYIALVRYIDSNATPELEEQYSKDAVNSVFLRPGIELGLADFFALYGGARFITSADRSEYYLQMRFRNSN